jgi:hypothetical protein
MSDATGQRFGQFKLGEALGRGPGSEVYRASRVSGGGPVAVKLLYPEVIAAEALRGRLTALLNMTEGVKHPGIAEIHGFGEDDGRFYIATELAEDGSLCDRCSPAAAVDVDRLLEAVGLVQQATDAVAYAHARRLAHLGLKPGNLLLQTDESGMLRVKVTDFGMSSLYTSGTGERLGHLGFLAPEQWRGEETDERTDIYSLGILLYLAATGELPFPANAAATAMYHHLFVAPKPRSGVPSELETIILRCLAKVPAERYEHAGALALALQQASAVIRTGTTARAAAGTAVIPAPAAHRPPLSALPGGTAERGKRGRGTGAAGSFQPGSAPYTPGGVPSFQVLDARGAVIMRGFLQSAGAVIGSAWDCAIRLDAPEVEAYHARLDWDGHRITVTDLGSKNSTFLDDHRLLPQWPQEWSPGQRARIGRYWIAVEQGRIEGPRPRIDVIVDKRNRSMILVPGNHVDCRITLANYKTTVEHLSLVVEGIPPAWVRGLETEVALNPYDKITIVLGVNVPKSPEARAGEYTITIRSRSLLDLDESEPAIVHWTIAPFKDVTVGITPAKAAGRARSRYTVALSNRGNATESLRLAGADDDRELSYHFADDHGQQSRPKIDLPEGGRTTLHLNVEAAKRRRFGGAWPQHFRVTATPEDRPDFSVAEAQFVQLAIFPTWMLAAVAIVVVALLAVLPVIFRPRIRSVEVDPPNPLPGEAVTVIWDARRATHVELRPVKAGIAGKQGSYRVSRGFDKETVLTVIASNFFGTDQREVTIAVRPKDTLPPPAPAEVELSTSAPSVIKGGSVTISWNVRGGRKAEFNLTGDVPLQGSYTDFPEQDQTYTITAYNSNGVATKKAVIVKVAEPEVGPPPKPRLQIDKTRINQGEYVLFSWEARATDSVRIDAITGTTLVGTSGQKQARLRGKGQYTFTLISSNEAGLESKSDPVSVNVNCTLKQKIFKTCNSTPQIEWK